MQWLSINDVKKLVNDQLYEIREGSVFDRERNYVGRIDGNSFSQNQSYRPSRQAIARLRELDEGDWFSAGRGW